MGNRASRKYRPASFLRGVTDLAWKANLSQNIFVSFADRCLLLKERSCLWRANSVLSGKTPFTKGLSVKKTKQEIPNFISLCKMAEKSTKYINPLKRSSCDS